MISEAPRNDISETYFEYVEEIHDAGNEGGRRTGKFMRETSRPE
jgi:hypothetical protein